MDNHEDVFTNNSSAPKQQTNSFQNQSADLTPQQGYQTPQEIPVQQPVQPPDNIPMDNRYNEPIQQPVEPMQNSPIEPEMQNQPTQGFAPPVPDFSASQNQGFTEPKKGFPILGAIIAVLAIIIIFALSFFLYYYATKPVQIPTVPTSNTAKNNNSATETETPSNNPATNVPAVTPTDVVTFAVPETLPATPVAGNCVVSVAQPYRIDSYRCTVGKKIYDPCFSAGENNLVYCQMDPTDNTKNIILVKNSKALPTITLPEAFKENWGWFVKLRDGTFCSPFTGSNFGGAKPVVNGKAAIYGCRSSVATEQVLIIGDLVKGEVWKAQKVIATKQGTVLTQKTSELVEVDTVWQ